jgi:RHS repeat-associated protein
LERSVNPDASGELQDFVLNGRPLDWYDYGARFYDPTLGRFHSVDPWAEKYNNQSTYLYAYNNPIRYTDFLGLGASDEVDNDNDKNKKEEDKKKKEDEDKKKKEEEQKKKDEKRKQDQKDLQQWWLEVSKRVDEGKTKLGFWNNVKGLVGDDLWKYVPVAFSYSINLGLNPAGGGNYSPWGYLFILKGKDEFKGKHITDINIGPGWDISATVIKTDYYYTGNPNELTLENFEGPKISVNFSYSYMGVEVTGTISFSNVNNFLLIGISTGAGIGMPGPGGGLNGGVTKFYNP